MKIQKFLFTITVSILIVLVSCKKGEGDEPEGNKQKVLKFETEIIDQSGTSAGVGYFCKMVIDAAKGLHIVYEDEDQQKLKYAYKPSGGSWQKSDIASCAEKSFASMAIDINGGIHVVYANQGAYDLVYAYKASVSSNWASSNINGNYHVSSAYLDMAVDPNMGVHLVCKDNSGSLYKATYLYLAQGSTNWTKETIENIDQTGEEPGICIENSTIHVCYGTLGGKLQYAKKAVGSGSWSIATVANSSQEIMYTNLAADMNGGIRIVYRDYNDGALKTAYKEAANNNWSVNTLDNSYGCEFPGIEIDAMDTCRVSYSINDEKVSYAYKNPGENTWNKYEIDPLGTDDYYQYTDVVSDNNGNTYVCYRRKLSASSSESVLAITHIYWDYE